MHSRELVKGDYRTSRLRGLVKHVVLAYCFIGERACQCYDATDSYYDQDTDNRL
jgi:hypothetical protein